MRVIQVAQRAENFDRAAEFSSALLGTRPLAMFDPPGLLFFNLDGVRLLLERGAPPSLIYLGGPDVRRLMNDLEARGVEVVAAPEVIFRHKGSRLGPAGTDEWMGFIKDSGQRRGWDVAIVSPAVRLGHSQPASMTPLRFVSCATSDSMVLVTRESRTLIISGSLRQD